MKWTLSFERKRCSLFFTVSLKRRCIKCKIYLHALLLSAYSKLAPGDELWILKTSILIGCNWKWAFLTRGAESKFSNNHFYRLKFKLVAKKKIQANKLTILWGTLLIYSKSIINKSLEIPPFSFEISREEL